MLRVVFDAVYTAQDVELYKPSPRNFAYMLQRLKNDFDIEKSSVLHVAQSLLHDHVPANQCGIASAWINRRYTKKGWGATKPPGELPRYDFQFVSMAALVQAHQKELSG